MGEKYCIILIPSRDKTITIRGTVLINHIISVYNSLLGKSQMEINLSLSVVPFMETKGVGVW